MPRVTFCLGGKVPRLGLKREAQLQRLEHTLCLLCFLGDLFHPSLLEKVLKSRTNVCHGVGRSQERMEWSMYVVFAISILEERVQGKGGLFLFHAFI